jgi:hypothetical protein
MKSPQNFATVISALVCSILLCFVVNPCIGFQQPLQTLPCSFAGCRSKSLHSSLASTSKHFSRFGGRTTSEWWRNNSNEQKSNGPLMADASASAGEVKKGLFDKVRTPLILETLSSNVRLTWSPGIQGQCRISTTEWKCSCTSAFSENSTFYFIILFKRICQTTHIALFPPYHITHTALK